MSATTIKINSHLTKFAIISRIWLVHVLRGGSSMTGEQIFVAVAFALLGPPDRRPLVL